MKKIVLLSGLLLASFALSACVHEFAKVGIVCTLKPSDCN